MWKICKVLSRLPSDREIQQLSPYQIAWINQQIDIDEEEDFEKSASLAEYVGCFINHEAAQQARQSRKSRNGSEHQVQSTDFEKLVKEQFGRDFDAEAPPEFSTNEPASNRRILEGVSARDLQEIEVLRRRKDFVPQE